MATRAPVQARSIRVAPHLTQHFGAPWRPQMTASLGDMVGVRTKPKIAESITDLIGNTPLLKLGTTAGVHPLPPSGRDAPPSALRA